MTNDSFQLYIAQAGGGNILLHYGAKTTKEIKCILDFETQSGKNEYQMRLVQGSHDTLIFADEQIYFASIERIGEDSLPFFGAGHKDSMLLEYASMPEEKSQIVKTILDTMSRLRCYQFHDTSASADIKQYAKVQDKRYLHDNAGNLAAFLYMLKQDYPAYYKRIVSIIRQVAPFFDDFILEPISKSESIILEWKEKNSDMTFFADQLSDGTLRMMALITLLLQPELPSFICIDEPELGLHPYAIEVLASLLKSASRESQIIISTQSVSLVDQFEPEDIIVVDRHKGISTFERKNSEQLEDWLKDYSLGELWEKNVLGGRPSL